MSQSAPAAGSASSGEFDLTQFYQVFFEEAGENLASMENMLLSIDVTDPVEEDLHAIFRVAHSIKGGAATFGFQDVAQLTHELETLLDRVRKHALALSTEIVDTLLEAGDVLKAQLARHQAGGAGEAEDIAQLVATVRRLAEGGTGTGMTTPIAMTTTPATRQASEAVPQTHGQYVYDMEVGPLGDAGIFDSIVELFSDIPNLGSIAPDLAYVAPMDTLPSTGIDDVTTTGKSRCTKAAKTATGTNGERTGKAAKAPKAAKPANTADSGITRRYRVVTTSPESELRDLLSFHVSREQVRFTLVVLSEAAGAHAQDMRGDRSAKGAQSVDPGYGLFDDPDPSLPASPASLSPSTTTAAEVAKPALKTRAEHAPASSADASTLRVSVEKVDQLINLVGELVITQAMLSNRGRDIDPILHEGLLAGFADLERNTRSLQDAVMSIRMIPMAVVFNRFPRMLRDLAAKLGKEIDLKTSGEATELDKGLIEKITDPLNHLIRNAVDHGIESPEKRLAAGKTARGTIFLSASHQGGSIVIEVRDDGAGLNRGKILAKAKKQGLAVRDDMTDREVWQLIWAPGFSTAEQVTDVSGRGVGMDVVTKSITALGGTAEVDSAEGFGTRVSIRLPLTLAIMDGMSVAVNDEHYIIPLANVVESMQVTDGMLRTVVGQGRVVEVRSEFLPVVSLHEVFLAPPPGIATASRILVIIEFEGAKTALMVDHLIGQYQVVVKNLEANYRKVPGVSGATIMGDGRVALILDVAQVVAAGNGAAPGAARVKQLSH